MPGFEARSSTRTTRRCPTAPPGELVLRADEPFAFATGYWRMPEQTVASWRNLWFHSGDRVVRDPDGCFRFLDRLKDAIRRRGENISGLGGRAGAAVATRTSPPPPSFPVPSELGEDEVMAVVVPRAGRRARPGRADPPLRAAARLLRDPALRRDRRGAAADRERQGAEVRAARARRQRDDLGPRGRRGYVAAADERAPSRPHSSGCGACARASSRPRARRAPLARSTRPTRASTPSPRSTRSRCCATPPRPIAAAPPATTGPLLGLPITIKDSLAVAGLPCRSGSAARADNVADDGRDGRARGCARRGRSSSPRRPCPSTCGRTRPRACSTGARSTLRPGAHARAARAAARRR